MTIQDFLVCARCGDRIGVYEPVVVLDTGGVVLDTGGGRTTSVAREPELRTAATLLIHSACASPVPLEAGA